MVFWRDGPWDFKLFHVEQFEIGRNDGGFERFLAVMSTVRTESFYGRTDGDLRWISPYTVTVEGDC
jgi:hypothetical protein